MRRWLLIFLLTLLPLQLSWAEAASYCLHEQGGPSQHFGHHEHQHAGHDAASADTLASIDSDCGACHAGCAIAILGSGMPGLPLAFSSSPPPPPLRLASRPPSLPDRPSWARLA